MLQKYKLVAQRKRGASFASAYELSKQVLYGSVSHAFEIQSPDRTVQRIEAAVAFPKPPGISPYVVDAEAAIIPFCKSFGLYRFDQLASQKSKIDRMEEGFEKNAAFEKLESKEMHIANAIGATGFGWLVGMVAPDLNPPEIIDITLYYLTLFDHDDDADRAMSGGMSVADSESVSRAMLLAYQGQRSEIPERYKEHKRIRAFLDLYDRFFEKFHTSEHVNIREEFVYSLHTLRDYLNSVQSERRYDVADDPISIEAYRQLRSHTGGIHHAISVICLAYGVDFRKLRDQYMEFQYMIESVAKAVGLLNDYYSAPAELMEIYKRIEKDGDHVTDEAVVKSRIQSNLLLLHWRDGLSLEAAATETLKEYTSHMKSFYVSKSIIYSEIKKNPELRMATYACEGWLFGHGPWGALSGRYNQVPGLVGSSDAVYEKITR
jgi:hypothetical protein